MSNYSIFIINLSRASKAISPRTHLLYSGLYKYDLMRPLRGFWVCFEEPTSDQYNWYVPFNFIGHPFSVLTNHAAAEPLFVPRNFMIRLGNIKSPYIDTHLDDIRQKFESYVLSVDRLDHSSIEYNASGVSCFPDGIYHLKQLIASRERKRPCSLADNLQAAANRQQHQPTFRQQSHNQKV
ncbi:hypothetical protein [Fannyhessea vaginae]|uniref:hypothetical protein n=1 Tax=Fannyhessea vaginae TaxID=82135 RepID=UPI00288BC013|nr:hypothetical protein [Fannyhessea vaginae]